MLTDLYFERTDLYLERIGLIKPTIVKRNNNGEIERLESIGLDIASLVAFWRKCFDLNEPLFEKIILHCKSKDFNEISQRTATTSRSVRELLAEQGVECIIDDEWFENCDVKSEDSVVLSREKYEAYKKLAEAVYEEGAFNHYDNVINSAKIMFKDRKKLVKDTSNETAEKIFKMLISKLESNQFLSGKRIIMEVDVENLAKQFDVEIEEL